MDLRRRLSQGLSASALSKVTLLLSQILTVPLIVGAWGASRYGEWVVLSSLASYLTYGGIGLAPALRGEMVAAYATGGREAITPHFQSAFSVMLALVSFVLAGFSLAQYFFPIARVLNIHQISEHDLHFVLLMLSLQIGAGLIGGIVSAALASIGRYAIPDFVTAIRLACELSLSALILLKFKAGVVVLATMLATSAVASNLILFAALTLQIPSILKSWRVDVSRVGALLRPMLGALGINLSYNGVLVQAPRLILAAVSGGAAVATYTVASQLVRVARIVVEVPSTAPMLEVASYVHQGRLDEARRLLFIFTRIAAALALCLALGIALLGGEVVFHWSNKVLRPSTFLICSMAISMMPYALGLTSLEGLLALNRVAGAVKALLFIAPLFVVAAYFAAKRMGGEGVAMVLCVTEMLFAFIVIRNMCKIIGCSGKEFFGQLVRPRLREA